MRADKRTPFSKSQNDNRPLRDSDITAISRTLDDLKKKDFPTNQDFENIKKSLLEHEIRSLKLCKLLYCIGYKKEMFIHLGVIVESKLNSIIELYETEKWKTPNKFVDEATQKITFDKYKKKMGLSEKAEYLAGMNLLNNLEASEQAKHKIQSLRFLRNYGGHSKSLNEFFDTILDSQPHCDAEIHDAIHLIEHLHLSLAYLKKHSPAKI